MLKECNLRPRDIGHNEIFGSLLDHQNLVLDHSTLIQVDLLGIMKTAMMAEYFVKDLSMAKMDWRMVEGFEEVEGVRLGWCLEGHLVAFDPESLATWNCDTWWIGGEANSLPIIEVNIIRNVEATPSSTAESGTAAAISDTAVGVLSGNFRWWWDGWCQSEESRVCAVGDDGCATKREKMDEEEDGCWIGGATRVRRVGGGGGGAVLFRIGRIYLTVMGSMEVKMEMGKTMEIDGMKCRRVLFTVPYLIKVRSMNHESRGWSFKHSERASNICPVLPLQSTSFPRSASPHRNKCIRLYTFDLKVDCYPDAMPDPMSLPCNKEAVKGERWAILDELIEF
jgi:hypothetical protein